MYYHLIEEQSQDSEGAAQHGYHGFYVTMSGHTRRANHTSHFAKYRFTQSLKIRTRVAKMYYFKQIHGIDCGINALRQGVPLQSIQKLAGC